MDRKQTLDSTPDIHDTGQTLISYRGRWSVKIGRVLPEDWN